MFRHGKGVDEEEEEGGEGSVRDRSSSPTSAEIDLLVHTVEYTHTCIQIDLGLDPTGRADFFPLLSSLLTCIHYPSFNAPGA